MKNDNMNSDKIKDAAGKYADKRSFVLPYDGSNKFYDDKIHDCANESFKAGAEWAIAQFQSQQKQADNEKTAMGKLIEYFEQQLRLQRESTIKYTGEEAFFDALDVCKNAYRTEQSQQKQSGYRVVSKDEWFAMRTDERHQLVAGRDLKTGEAIWLAENKPEPQKQSAVWVSVRDKLPDDSHGRVLVYAREVNDLGISYFVWNCSYSKAHGFTDKLQHYDVTHWMPLPEPPKTPPHENL